MDLAKQHIGTMAVQLEQSHHAQIALSEGATAELNELITCMNEQFARVKQ